MDSFAKHLQGYIKEVNPLSEYQATLKEFAAEMANGLRGSNRPRADYLFE